MKELSRRQLLAGFATLLLGACVSEPTPASENEVYVLKKDMGVAHYYGAIYNLADIELRIDTTVLEGLCKDPKIGVDFPDNHLALIFIVPESLKTHEQRQKVLPLYNSPEQIESAMKSHFRTARGGYFQRRALAISLPDEINSVIKAVNSSNIEPWLLVSLLGEKLTLTFVEIMRSYSSSLDLKRAQSNIDRTTQLEIRGSRGIMVNYLG